MELSRKLVCEFLGTAALVATVVGTGILAQKVGDGNVAVSVMAVAVATGCVLTAIILSFGSISCHLNPIVTLMSAIRRDISWSAVAPFILTQIIGGIVGTLAANLMFDLPFVSISAQARTGTGQWLGEFIATFGLIGVIIGCGRSTPSALPAAIGCYICGAIWFTSSTCFANPAVTIARIFTDTLTGIRPSDVVPFILSQLAGAAAALALFGWLFDSNSKEQEKAIIERLEKELVAPR